MCPTKNTDPGYLHNSRRPDDGTGVYVLRLVTAGQRLILRPTWGDPQNSWTFRIFLFGCHDDYRGSKDGTGRAGPNLGAGEASIL